MMRTLLFFMLLAAVLPAHAAGFWSGLWRNADQQGEALLQQGDAGTAAKVYADPRRKAYAKLKSGDYTGAAQDLGDLHESDDDYNRGNALTHAGNLQGALKAYDAALKSKPDNQDARHNRELVQNALKQQPQQQQNSDDSKSKDEKKDGQQGKDQNATGQNSSKQNASNQGNQDKQGDQSGKENKGQQEKSGKGQDSSAQKKQEQQGNESQKSQEGTGKEGKNQNGQPSNDMPQKGKQDGKQTGQGKDGKNEQQPSANSNAQTGQAPAKDDAEQARRDAEASLAKPAADGKNGAGAGDESGASLALPATAPKSEQQIAQEQWLRSIPDDPGGLLRRKFMIQHMMRQQKAQQ